MGVRREEALGKRLRRLREEKGLTQSQLAHPRFTGAYISQIESGKRHPGPPALKHLAQKLGIEPRELITGRPPDFEATLELALSSAMKEVFDGDFGAAESRLLEVLSEAKPLALTRVEARAEELLGLSSERQGHIEQALEHFEGALELREQDSLPMQVEALAGIARATLLQGDVRYSVHLLETYLGRLKRLSAPDPRALVRTYSSLVASYFAAGLPSKAAEAASEALRLEPQIENPQEVASMHLNAARAMLHEGRPDDAMNSLRRAQDLYLTIGRPQDAAYAQINQGIVLIDEGRLDEARVSLLRSLENLDPTTLARAWALNELARVERMQGNLDEAERFLKEAAPLLEESHVQELAMNKRELGATIFERDPQIGEKHLREAIELYERTDNPVAVATTYKMLGQAMQSRGDHEAANAALVAGIEYLERNR